MRLKDVKSLPYRRDIEGLRGLAVLSVLFFHYNLFKFNGGFVGVDIFFVLSGYLITLIIVNGKSSFSYLSFYESRIRRLLPAFYFMLIIVICMALRLFFPGDLQNAGASIVSSSVFLSNAWFFKSTGGYFDIPSTKLPLLHTWSLSIEEQYYLLYPVFIMLLHKFYSKENILKILIFLTLISLIISQMTLSRSHNFSFYLIPSRGWELLLGGVFALAFFHKPLSTFTTVFFPWVGFIGITIAIMNYSENTAFPGYNALLPCVGTAFILLGSSERSVINSLLSHHVMRFFGRISYSLYLWHWPVFVFAQYYLTRNLDNAEKWTCIFISVTIAFFSYKYIEQPFRKTISSRNAIISLGGVFLCIFVIGLSFYLSKGFPQRMNSDILQVLATETKNINPLRDKCHSLPVESLKQRQFCSVGALKMNAHKFSVIGDSHVDALIPGIDAEAKKAGLSGIMLSYAECMPLIGIHQIQGTHPCEDFMNESYKIVLSNPDIKTVFLIALWGRYAYGTKVDTLQTYLYKDSKTKQLSLDENKQVFERGFARTVNLLLKNGKQVVVVAAIPEQNMDIPKMLALSLYLNKASMPPLSLKQYVKRQEFVNGVFKKWESQGKIKVIHPEEILCKEGQCSMTAFNIPLYYDSHHLSKTGAMYIKSIYHPIFLRLKNPDIVTRVS